MRPYRRRHRRWPILLPSKMTLLTPKDMGARLARVEFDNKLHGHTEYFFTHVKTCGYFLESLHNIRGIAKNSRKLSDVTHSWFRNLRGQTKDARSKQSLKKRTTRSSSFTVLNWNFKKKQLMRKNKDDNKEDSIAKKDWINSNKEGDNVIDKCCCEPMINLLLCLCFLNWLVCPCCDQSYSRIHSAPTQPLHEFFALLASGSDHACFIISVASPNNGKLKYILTHDLTVSVCSTWNKLHSFIFGL